MGFLRRKDDYLRYLAINGLKRAINVQCWALKGMAFTHGLNKVHKSPSNPHGYLTPRNDAFRTHLMAMGPPRLLWIIP